MKINFLNSISSKAGAKNSRGTPAFLKKKQMFINVNALLQRMLFTIVHSIRRARFSPRLCWSNMGAEHKQTIGCGQKSFFEGG